MSNVGFSNDWLKVCDADPYAALGVSVEADDRRIMKRYRRVAKVLHPDTQLGKPEAEQRFAQQVLARIINPAYQRIKQQSTRQEALARLRIKVRVMARQERLSPTFESAQQLLRLPDEEVDGFYENTLTQLIEHQFDSPATFHRSLPRIAQLNLVFLRRKMGDIAIREKRTGLVATPSSAKVTAENAAEPAAGPAEPPAINYAEKYSIRARTYLSQKNYELAVRELREAIKIEPNNVEFHSMLGQTHLMLCRQQSSPLHLKLARVHLKRALELNPHHEIAGKYLDRLDELSKSLVSKPSSSAAAPSPAAAPKNWISRLFGRR